MSKGLKVGFHPPLQCARNRTDCRSLAQIISSDTKTFVCCGEFLGDRLAEPRDRWAFCLKADQSRPTCFGTDINILVDRRDMSHMAAVLGMGLAMVIPPDQGTTPLPDIGVQSLPRETK